MLMEIVKKIEKIFFTKRKSSAVILGMMLSGALPPYFQLWMAIVSFSGLIYLLSKEDRLKKLFVIGYCFGFGFFSCGFYWIGNALLVDMVHTGWLYPIVLFLNGAFFGLFITIPAMITVFGKNILSKVLFFAASWGIFAEWFRGFFLTGFPWNPISSVLSFSYEMLQILAIFGTYGTSILVVLFSSLPVIYLVKRNKIIIFLFLFFPFAVWLYGYYSFVPYDEAASERNIKVRLVQPSIPQEIKWDKQTIENNFNKYIDLSVKKDNSDVDFIVWGETASPFDFIYDMEHRISAASIVPQKGYLISGFLRREFKGNYYIPYNSLAVINADANVIDSYDKSHLVPFGEYIPFRKILPNWIRPIANNVAEFGRGIKYQTINIGNFPTMAPLICYEIIFSDNIVRKKDNPLWAVVLTNDGWYGISSGPYQHLVAAQMRAIEEGISIVRSANSGISAVITPYGEILGEIPLAEEGFSDVVIKIDMAHETLFGSYGNTIPILLGIFILILAWMFQYLKLY